MRRKLAKADFDALTDAMKAFYKLDIESGVYLLQIEGEDDPAELRRARDREKQAAIDSKTRADQLQAELDKIKGAAARSTGDIDSIESSWKEKLSDATTAHVAEVGKLKEQLTRLLVHNVAQNMAAKIAGENAEIILPHIQSRMSVELDGETPKTRVLGLDGKPTALTVEELEKDFVANPKFKAIIIASKASGGAPSNRTSSNSSAVPNEKKFSDLTESERVDWFKTDPKAFTAARDAHLATLRKV